ncbi:hypothetical protein [Massilia sp. CT11-137]|uniref:hypothetical protein n=1 Tax=Massilia sp. CT11-137 TaxID=3393901 RepID=UPI0039AF3BF8
MNADAELNVFACLNFIRDNAPAYAKAKSERVYLEEFRKTKKALCMRAAESSGVNAISAQERDAYADPEYAQLLDGLRAAVEEEERLRWMIVAAQAKIEVWRTIEANRRAEAKTL